MVEHAWNPSTEEVEEEGLEVQGQGGPCQNIKIERGWRCNSVAECWPGIHEVLGSICGTAGRGEGRGRLIHLHWCLPKSVADANTAGSSKVSPQVPTLPQNVISPMDSKDKNREICVDCWELMTFPIPKNWLPPVCSKHLLSIAQKDQFGAPQSQSHQVVLILDPHVLGAAAANVCKVA